MTFTMWAVFILGLVMIVGFNVYEYLVTKSMPEAGVESEPAELSTKETGGSAVGHRDAAATEANTAAVRELLLAQETTNELLQRLLRKADELGDKAPGGCM